MKITLKLMTVALVAVSSVALLAAPPRKNHGGKPAPRKEFRPGKPVKSTVKKTEVNSAAYRPARGEHTVVFTKRGDILFDQRVVGAREMSKRIKMLTYDRPLPRITVRYEAGVNMKRVENVISEFRKAGFRDIRKERTAPPKRMRGPKREKPSMWNPANWF